MNAALLAWPMALVAGMIAPGPINLGVLALGVGGRPGSAAGFAGGASAGDVLIAIAILGGVSLVDLSRDTSALLSLTGGVMLITLGTAMFIGSSASHKRRGEAIPAAGAASGLAVALTSPKTLVLHLSAAPLLLDETPLDAGQLIAAAVTVAILNILCLAAYAGGGAFIVSGLEAERRGRALTCIAAAGLVLAGCLLLFSLPMVWAPTRAA
ncbi:LysE family transporter [Brevundimonas diminuta]|uniref:Lysine transporter LysE n=1 Tax=Brevundimonas diminuta TaxID=293 RepID=A0A1Z3LVL4_BREDI|nr:LysE family transporter [Brevundimonas diminuta]ASD26233.1 hypothetical protein CD943_04610 [Brevundimonas diminuta]